MAGIMVFVKNPALAVASVFHCSVAWVSMVVHWFNEA